MENKQKENILGDVMRVVGFVHFARAHVLGYLSQFCVLSVLSSLRPIFVLLNEQKPKIHLHSIIK